MTEIRILEYLDREGRSSYRAWFEGLNAPAAAKVATALYQLTVGNWSNVKSVESGVYERKVDFGPGYRVYFGKDGGHVVIVLGGSTKQRQQPAIKAVKERWIDYRRQKHAGET